MSQGQFRTIANQNALDVLLQYCGSVDPIASFLVMNEISITEVIEGGRNLKHEVFKNDVLNYYQKYNVSIATGYTTDGEEQKTNEFIDEFPYSF